MIPVPRIGEKNHHNLDLDKIINNTRRNLKPWRFNERRPTVGIDTNSGKLHSAATTIAHFGKRRDPLFVVDKAECSVRRQGHRAWSPRLWVADAGHGGPVR